MELAELLKTLRQRQIHLAVTEEKLTYKAPKGAVDVQIRESLKAHKTTLIQILGDTTQGNDLPDPAELCSSIVPLTTAQKQIWIAYQTLPQQQATEQYHVTLGFDAPRQLDLARLKQAIATTVASYDALNLRFRPTDQGIGQSFFSSPPEIDFQSIDHCDLDSATHAFVARKFSLLSENEAPYRIAILACDNQYRIIWCLHHMICDGYSLSLISDRLLREYCAPETNQREPDYAFLAYAYGQNDSNREAEMQAWQASLKGIEPELWLEQADPFSENITGEHGTGATPAEPDISPSDTGSKLHSIEFNLCDSQTEHIDNQARSLKISTFEYLLSVYTIVVYQLTHQDSFSVSIPESGRSPVTAETVGLFANSRLIAIKADFQASARQTIESLVSRIRHCLQLPEVPMEYLLSRLKADNGATLGEAKNAFQQLGFSYYHDSTGVLNTGSVMAENTLLTPLPLSRSDHRKKMSLLIHRSGNRMKLEWHFQKRCLSARLAEHHCRLFEKLLMQLDLTTEAPLLQQLPQPEWQRAQQRLVALQRQSEKPLPLRDSDTRGIRWLFGPHDDNDIAIRFSDSPEQQTYAALKQQVNTLALQLHAQGVRPAQRVYLDLKRSHQSVLATLAVWTLGAVYCPLNSRLPQTEKSAIAAGQWVLTQTAERWAGERGADAGKVIEIDQLLTAIENSQTAEAPASTASISCVEHCWQPGDPFYHLQTSGTTGQAKAVEVTFNNILHYMAGAATLYKINNKKHVLHHTDLSFDVSIIEFMVGFYSGGTMTIHQGGMLDAAELSRLLREYRIDTLSLTASLWQRLVASPDFVLDNTPRQFKIGGEPMPAAITEQWLERYGLHQELFNVYGPAETTVGITGIRIRSTENLTCNNQVSIGCNFLGYTLVCDPYGKPLPAGHKGELWILGPTVSNGYFQQPELTKKSFFTFSLDSETIPGYKSGDLVIQNQNKLLYVLGRKDHQIKWRGYRMELNAIELCLQQSEWVDSCVLLPEYNDKQHIESLSAIIVPANAPAATGGKLAAASAALASRLKSHLLDSLPDYMLPSGFLITPSLPLRVSGKVDRNALENRLQEFRRSENSATGAAILSPLEAAIASLWKELLKQPHIDIYKSFFDHGGHSLLMLDLLNRLNHEFDSKLELLDLFEHSTVSAMATLIQPQQKKVQHD